MANEYEVPALFGANVSAPDAVAESSAEVASGLSDGMRFMVSLGESGADEGAQLEAALADFPTFRKADAEGSLEAVNGVPALLADEHRRMRSRVGIAVAAIAILALLSLLVDPQGGFFAIDEALACYDLALRQFIASVVAPSDLWYDSEILAAHEGYFCVLEAVGATVASVLCGAACCVGGLLFQSSFRRDMAVVPITGVSAAVLVGQGIAFLATGAVLRMSWVAMLVACAVGFVPTIALRFRLNALNLSDEGARQLGIDGVRLRNIADGCAIVLLVASQVQAGPIFPLACAVSPFARSLFGFEFRKALVGSALLGAAALLFARLVPFPTWVSSCLIAAAIIAKLSASTS